MKRYVDWPVRLQQCVLEWSDVPFEYGRHDCALWAAAAVKAMTGVDLADGLRDYDSEEDGLALVRAHGFADHVDVFRQSLPTAERIKVGDLAVVERDGRVAVGVAQARGIYVMLPDRGLALVPRSWAKTGMTV